MGARPGLRRRSSIAAIAAAGVAVLTAVPAEAAVPAQHAQARAQAAVAITPPADPALLGLGLPALATGTGPRLISTRADASTLGFDGDPSTARAGADALGTKAARRSGESPGVAGSPSGTQASAEAGEIDLSAGRCPDPGADGVRTLAASEAHTLRLAAGLVSADGPSSRSRLALVPTDGDGLAVRATATTSVAAIRVAGLVELRVVRAPILEAVADGSDGGAAIRWSAPIIDVVSLATGETLARLDEGDANFRLPDETEFGGRNQPLRISLASPYEELASPDGGFARARAALVRIKLQPSLELGELTIGTLEASATAPRGGVRCDGSAPAARDRPHVVVYEGNNGYEHVARHEANRTLSDLANASGSYSFEITDQATFLRDDKLAGADMVMFNNNVGNMPVGDAQKDALKEHLLAGGGAGGIHSAADANYAWDEYGEMFGARFDGHPHIGYIPELAARLVVEDGDSPITSGWDGQDSFMWADEYYRWRPQDIELLRTDPDVNVLLSLDTNTVLPLTQQGVNPYGPYRVEFQPIAWTKTFRGAGRVFYTNMGHNGFGYSQAPFRTMLLEGIRWVTAG